MESCVIHKRRKAFNTPHNGGEDARYLGVFVNENQSIGHIAVPYIYMDMMVIMGRG